MPKKGYESITIPDELHSRISNFVEQSQGLVPNKTQAFMQAWQVYEKLFLEEKNPKPVQIGNKLVGHNQPAFVCAEIGLNHNGSMEICKNLIDMAVEMGCDAVKFQKRTPDVCVPEKHKHVPRETPWGTMTYLEYRKKIEFEKKEYEEIDEYCKSKGIIWYASAWDVPSVDFLLQFDIPCFKVPSACLTDDELLKKIKSTGKPIILSTGMSTMEQIRKAVDLLGEENLILLHCNSTYPAAEEDLHLNVIKTFRRHFNCPIGYSGHEVGVFSTVVAVAIGACMVERHITLDRAMWGSDQSASLEKRGLELVAREAHAVHKYLGEHTKKVHESEKQIMQKLRRH